MKPALLVVLKDEIEKTGDWMGYPFRLSLDCPHFSKDDDVYKGTEEKPGPRLDNVDHLMFTLDEMQRAEKVWAALPEEDTPKFMLDPRFLYYAKPGRDAMVLIKIASRKILKTLEEDNG